MTTFMRGSMNKKLLFAGVGVIALAGAYIFIGNYEAKIEKGIREGIAQTQITVEDVSYNALSGTAHLSNVFFETVAEDITVVFNASLLSFSDVNTDIKGAKEEEMPVVFGEMSIKDLSVELKDANQVILTFKLDSYTVSDYAHNVVKLTEEYEKKIFSEEFFEALLNYSHSGIEMEGYKLIVEEGPYVEPMQTTVEKVTFAAVENPQLVSIAYKNLEFVNDDVKFKSAVFSIDEWQIPDAKKLATAAQSVLAIVAASQYDTYQPQLDSDDLLMSIYDTFSYEDSAPFVNISIRDMDIFIKDESLQGIGNKNILMEKFDIDLEFGDTASSAYVIKNLVISPEYLSLLDEELYDIINAFITDDIVINVSVENVADLKTNMITSTNEASVSQLFETSGETVMYYQDQNIWNILLMSMPEDPFTSITYKSMKSSYTDKGLIPLIVNIGAVATRLPVEALVQQVKNETAAVTGFLKTGEPKFDDVITDVVEASLAMFEKPGSLDVEITFDTPHSVEYLLDNMPQDFEFEINVDQGSKTILELTPDALLNKK